MCLGNCENTRSQAELTGIYTEMIDILVTRCNQAGT